MGDTREKSQQGLDASSVSPVLLLGQGWPRVRITTPARRTQPPPPPPALTGLGSGQRFHSSVQLRRRHAAPDLLLLQPGVAAFGRGSKQLGIPTANFPKQVVDNLPTEMPTGIYCGWASVGSGDVHKMVVSIGWNPYYKNTKKSMETHILHTFKEVFYVREILNVAIVGYLRPEKNFDSLESFISAIQY